MQWWARVPTTHCPEYRRGRADALTIGQQLAPSTRPSARYRHTAVWTGSEMIIWGGYGNGTGLNTGGRYDPTTDSWTATSTANAPAARQTQRGVDRQ